MSNLYAKRFKKILNEADDSSLERDAMEASLDDGIEPTSFDASAPDDLSSAQSQLADVLSSRNEKMIGELQGWIDNISQFLEDLNGEAPNSIQSRLANAEPDTIFDKMKQSQQTKISRVASDLAALQQGFLGFMAQTKNSKFRYVAWTLGGALGFLSMAGSHFMC